MMKFVGDPSETPGQRVARFATEAVADGPMGAFLRRERYVSFLEIWAGDKPTQSAAQLSRVKTSCAVCASAVLGYAGKELKKPWRADGSWGITSWLGLSFRHPSWIDAEGHEPSVGDVFYRGSKTGFNGHVGIFARKIIDNGKVLWVTVEGGGNLSGDDSRGMRGSDIKATNGTVMRMSKPKDVWDRDSLYRGLTGWWRISYPTDDGLAHVVPTWDEILDKISAENAGGFS